MKTSRTNAEFLQEKLAAVGNPQPTIFGHPMEARNHVVPDWIEWTADVAGIEVSISHRTDGCGPWEVSISAVHAWNPHLKTLPEAEQFVEEKLRELRDALVKGIPQQ